MEAAAAEAPRAQPPRLLRLVEILGQRAVTEAEAERNRLAAAEHADELRELEALKKAEPARFDREPELLRRLRDLRNVSVRPRRARPAIEPLLPISESRWWAGIKSGRYPEGVKLGPRTTAWRAEEVYALLKNGAGVDQEQPGASVDEKIAPPA